VSHPRAVNNIDGRLKKKPPIALVRLGAQNTRTDPDCFMATALVHNAREPLSQPYGVPVPGVFTAAALFRRVRLPRKAVAIDSVLLQWRNSCFLAED
jgi:hypothetical protein